MIKKLLILTVLLVGCSAPQPTVRLGTEIDAIMIEVPATPTPKVSCPQWRLANIDWVLNNIETVEGWSLTGYSWLNVTRCKVFVKLEEFNLEDIWEKSIDEYVKAGAQVEEYNRVKFGTYLVEYTDMDGRVKPVGCCGLSVAFVF